MHGKLFEWEQIFELNVKDVGHSVMIPRNEFEKKMKKRLVKSEADTE